MRKRYGQSQIPRCPFCHNQATTTNAQKLPVCQKHTASRLDSLKCACGSWLDLKHGKYGAFFTCINCGTVTMRKALEINGI